MVVAFMHPQSKGTVSLCSTNPADPPLLDPQFLEHPFDRRTAIESVREGIRFLKTSETKEDETDLLTGPQGDTDEDILVCFLPPRKG